MASIGTSEGAPATAAEPGAGFRSNLRVVAHDHRTHDAPIEAPAGFDEIPVESMRRMAYDIKTGAWKEDRVDIKVEGKFLGQGGLKEVQRAFRRAEGSTADDGGITGATESGIRADWVAIVLKEYFGVILDSLGGREGIIQQFKRDVCMQWEAKALAIVFNAANPPKKIEVVEPVILLRDSGEVYFSEAFMVGTFFKHNDPAANILGMQEGFAVQKTPFRANLSIKMIILPRQARDKQGKLKKRGAFCAGRPQLHPHDAAGILSLLLAPHRRPEAGDGRAGRRRRLH
jgi:hypothetical protein